MNMGGTLSALTPVHNVVVDFTTLKRLVIRGLSVYTM